MITFTCVTFFCASSDLSFLDMHADFDASRATDKPVN